MPSIVVKRFEDKPPELFFYYVEELRRLVRYNTNDDIWIFKVADRNYEQEEIIWLVEGLFWAFHHIMHSSEDGVRAACSEPDMAFFIRIMWAVINGALLKITDDELHDMITSEDWWIDMTPTGKRIKTEIREQLDHAVVYEYDRDWYDLEVEKNRRA